MPESLVRVQKLTGKTLTFHEADLCKKEELRAVVAQVNKTRWNHSFFFNFFCKTGACHNFRLRFSTKSTASFTLLP